MQRAPRGCSSRHAPHPPGTLPIAQATKFDLLINLTTAKTLGLTIPPAILLRADRVIE